MTRFCYFTATTLDGYLADSDGSLDWLFEVPEEPGEPGESAGAISGFIDSVGALVMGASTYEWVLAHEQVREHPEKWREWYSDRPTWVFTHRELPPVPGVPLRFVSGEVSRHAQEIAESAGDRAVWLMGGGELVGDFDDAGLLDEVLVGIVPVTLGDGAPLLPRRITSDRLHLREVARAGQRIDAVYDVTRRARP